MLMYCMQPAEQRHQHSQYSTAQSLVNIAKLHPHLVTFACVALPLFPAPAATLAPTPGLQQVGVAMSLFILLDPLIDGDEFKAHCVFYMAVMAFATVLINGTSAKYVLEGLGLLRMKPQQLSVLQYVLKVRAVWVCKHVVCALAAMQHAAAQGGGLHLSCFASYHHACVCVVASSSVCCTAPFWAAAAASRTQCFSQCVPSQTARRMRCCAAAVPRAPAECRRSTASQMPPWPSPTQTTSWAPLTLAWSSAGVQSRRPPACRQHTTGASHGSRHSTLAAAPVL